VVFPFVYFVFCLDYFIIISILISY
jgi:hypothetical protein